jgi:SET domain-containing protein
MRNLIILLLIILFFLLINYKIISERFSNQEKEDQKYKKDNLIEYIDPNIKIKESSKGGRGIFATKDYQKDEIIEVCPLIYQEDNFQGLMRDYLFTYKGNDKAVAFGYCSMYNHDDNNNASWSIINSEQMKIKANREIKAGEEICVSYGSGYWNSRKVVKN